MKAGLVLTVFLVAAYFFTQGAGEMNDQDLVLHIAAESERYEEGEDVALAMVVLPEDNETTVSFRTGQRFDFLVLSDDREVWRWSKGKVFPQVLGEESYSGDRPGLFVITWDQKDNDGHQVPPGIYNVQGELASDPPAYSPHFEIEIRPSE